MRTPEKKEGGSIFLPPGGFTSGDSHSTPADLYAALDREFGFTLDPCPLDASDLGGAGLWGRDGLLLDWRGERVFCNPPYSNIGPWLIKAQEAEVAVVLVPARTDTAWWHVHAVRANEVRFLRGRLRFGEAVNRAPFPSVLLVYRAAKDTEPTRED